MGTKSLHITDLFKHFAKERQGVLKGYEPAWQNEENGLLNELLCRCHKQIEPSILRQALLDPYFPLGMLAMTLFANVDGMRFFINKQRPDLEPVLFDELVGWARTFLRIRQDIEKLFDPQSITCVPLDGERQQLPTNQWCTLCGVCCQIGGVPPEPPAGVRYPHYWETYLVGGAVDNQQMCPFLFQYHGEQYFFCSIHNIKPIACREFGEKECRRRLAERSLHQVQTARP